MFSTPWTLGQHSPVLCHDVSLERPRALKLLGTFTALRGLLARRLWQLVAVDVSFMLL